MSGHITLVNYDETALDDDANITNAGDGNIELFSGDSVDLGVNVVLMTSGGDIEVHAGAVTTFFTPAVVTITANEHDLLMDTTTGGQ